MQKLPPMPKCDPSELELNDAYGDHNIEYWVWSGKRLVPATPEQVVVIHGIEQRLNLTRREAIEELAEQRAALAPARPSLGHRITMLAARLMGLLRREHPRPSES
jgi:hypothetical protein